ncbi:MAG: acyl-CoA synthetase, partial [Rhodobacteraceae bacterium]|nr:acyl-CoA synthetase [Paracoccaceae bacterium]
MGFRSIDDMIAIENECPFGELGLPKTLYGMLTNTATKFPDRPAVTFQLLSGPKDPAETLTWRTLHQKTS